MMGTVFDIKEMTVHDGPGSRVTVFLKGCPLRCLWCHNPEGLESEPQIMVTENLCQHCGLCRRECGHLECAPFKRCVHACPNGLISISGTVMSAEQLAEKLLTYKTFLNSVGGGITFSGGEPLMQADFVVETSRKLCGMHKTLQTSGYADSDTFRRVLNEMDYVLFDLKLADRDEHKKYTGVYNDRIIENFYILREFGIPFAVRVPLIPGITDTEHNLKGISHIAGDSKVEIMRYNSFAGAKYKMVGKEFALPDLKSNDIDISVFKNARML